MLKVPAPFPQVGSYALLVDTNLPASQQRAELKAHADVRNDGMDVTDAHG